MAPAAAVPPSAASESPADRLAAPVQFVWRTDAEGCFSSISPEFAAVVGEHAADIVGRRFKDVSTTFELDPSGEIAGLLQRRDTWSGRTVLWPVAGSDRRIPVDLAALPVYGRDRSFEGFRGFGVARPGEAVIDHERIGLALVPNGKAPEETEPEARPAPTAEEQETPPQATVPAAVEAAAPAEVEPMVSEQPAAEPSAPEESPEAEAPVSEAEPVRTSAIPTR